MRDRPMRFIVTVKQSREWMVLYDGPSRADASRAMHAAIATERMACVSEAPYA